LDYAALAQQFHNVHEGARISVSYTATPVDIAAHIMVRYVRCIAPASLEPVTEVIDYSKVVTNRFP
jgi:hypothetical protein